MTTSSTLRAAQVNRYTDEDGKSSLALGSLLLARPERWEPSTGGPGTSTVCVLLVANDSEFTRGLARMLQICGHVVQCACTGAAALKLAWTFQPEFVLLDDELPDLTGYEIAALLHGISQSARIRIVSMSDYRGSGSFSQAAGCTHHLQKPVSAAEVTALLNEVQVDAH